jgi:hypothetical protein
MPIFTRQASNVDSGNQYCSLVFSQMISHGEHHQAKLHAEKVVWVIIKVIPRRICLHRRFHSCINEYSIC